MSDWQERITRETAPAIRVEHELRYRIAAPLIADSGAWADLGCGNGLAAAAALGDGRPERIVLVDVEPEVVARAAAELGLDDALQLADDLTDPDALRRIGETLLSGQGEAVVTCFEVVEHLDTFLPLLEWSGALAREHAATFVISVPNDAFWSIRNPHHRTAWGEGAFEELRRLLPAEQTLLRQVALAGSALVGWDGAPERHDLTTSVGGDGTIATHFIAAYGPRHDRLGPSALAVQADMIEQRRWERQRENDIALMQKVADEHETEVEALDRRIIEQRDELLKRNVWFEEWRTYIHELEQELGRPLSGVSPEKLPEPPA
jgi:SAM-dependent methyltransferase